MHVMFNMQFRFLFKSINPHTLTLTPLLVLHYVHNLNENSIEPISYI